MNLEIIQFSPNSMYSIFIVRDYLHANDLHELDNVLREQTQIDQMNRTTNVKGSMTAYKSLVNITECKNLLAKAILTLDSIKKIRNFCQVKRRWQYAIKDCWGMKHSHGDYSAQHNHFPCPWVGSFYTSVPKPSPFMEFIEFNQKVELESNMLIIFPGMINHSVSLNEALDERISMAFNIELEFE